MQNNGRLPISTREMTMRAAEHARALGTGRENLVYKAIEGTGNLSKNQARIVEQTIINQYGLQKNGGTLLNKINSISPSSPLNKLVPATNISSGSGSSGSSSLGGMLDALTSAIQKLSSAISNFIKR